MIEQEKTVLTNLKSLSFSFRPCTFFNQELSIFDRPIFREKSKPLSQRISQAFSTSTLDSSIPSNGHSQALATRDILTTSYGMNHTLMVTFNTFQGHRVSFLIHKVSGYPWWQSLINSKRQKFSFWTEMQGASFYKSVGSILFPPVSSIYYLEVIVMHQVYCLSASIMRMSNNLSLGLIS